MPQKLLIFDIEAKLTLPRKAFPLSSYVRYYTGRIEKGHRILLGSFLHRPKSAGVRIISKDKMFYVYDGGCSVVTLKYDIDTNMLLSLFCNGEA